MAKVGDMRNTYRLCGNLLEEGLAEDQEGDGGDNFELYLREIDCRYRRSMELAWDCVHWLYLILVLVIA